MWNERGISPKAVLFGFLADIGSSLVGSCIIGGVIGVILVARGASPDEVNAQSQEPIVLVLSLALGLACTVLGGYVAGRVAGRSEVLHGGLVGALGAVLGLAFVGLYPLWFNVAALVSVIPFAMLGGSLAAVRRGSAPQAADEPRDEHAEPDDGW
jgi:hypothetical protein